MAEDPRAVAPTPPLDADAIVARSFTRGRRGFDTDEVRAHLLAIAEQVRVLQTRNAELERRLSTAEAAAAQAQPAELDTHEVARLLGEETARVLETAREAADEMRAKASEYREQVMGEAGREAATARAEAESHAERVRTAADEEAAATRETAENYADELRRTTEEAAAALRSQAEAEAAELRERAQREAADARAEAEEYATRVRAEADDEVRTQRDAAATAATAARDEADADAAQTRADAEEYATRVRGEADLVMAERSAEAEAEAARIREAAELERDALLSRAEGELAAAREEADELLEEARRGRERVLGDLAKRRRAAGAQLEQLHAARDTLLDAYAQLRENIDVATGQLEAMVPAAKRAADEAVRRAEALPEQSIEELETELALRPEPAPARREGALGEAAAGAGAEVSPDEEPSGSGVDAMPSEPAQNGIDPGLSPAAVTEIPTGSTATTTVTKDRGRGRRRRHHERKGDPAFSELDTGELPAVEPSAEFEEVRLLAPTSPAPGSPAPEAAPAASEGGDEVEDLFARLRASREAPQASEEPGADEERAPAGARTAAAATSPEEETSDATEAAAAAEAEAEPDSDVQVEADSDTEAGLLALLEQRDQALAPVEAALVKQLKRVLSDEQSRILDGLRTAKSRPSLDALAGEVDEQHERYASATAGQLGDAWSAGVTFAARQDAAAATGPGEPDVSATAAELADNVVHALRTRLERCLAEDSDAATSGDPTAELELADRVRACYREWRSERLGEVVADVTVAAFTAGQFASFPARCSLQWRVDPSGVPCPDAEDNALAGPVEKGSPFPTGHACPPAHPGCRCLLVPAPSVG